MRLLNEGCPNILRNEIFPAISENNGCCGHQQLQPPWMMGWWALRELRKETKDTCHLAVIRLQPDPREQPEKTQDVKMQDTQAPRSRGAYQRNYFIEPLILPSSHTKKSIKFLEISSFLQLTIICTPSNHLPFIAKLYPSSPLTSLEQFSVGYWRCCLPDLTS